MSHIYRFVVDKFGEEEKLKINGKVIFINCPFKKSRKVFSFPRWRFNKKIYKNKIKQYNITCVDWFEYTPRNVLYYFLLTKFKNFDCLCFELAGFAPLTEIITKQFLSELKPHLDGRIVLIVIEKDSIETNNIFSEFPIYPDNS